MFVELLVRDEVVDGLDGAGGRDVGGVDCGEGRQGGVRGEILKGIVDDEVDEGGEVRFHACVWDIS